MTHPAINNEARALDQLNATSAALDFLSEALDQLDPVKPEHGPGIGQLLNLCAARIADCENVLKNFWARNYEHDKRTAAERGLTK